MTITSGTTVSPRVSGRSPRPARPLTSGVVAAGILTVALVLQVSVFSHVAWNGVVPNLVLLSVVGAGLARGAQFGLIAGFAAGVLLDLAPPADHIAGRWALALLIVGYVAGRVGEDLRPTVTALLATAAGCSFLGTSIFALTGILLRDPLLSVPDLLSVIGAALVFDVLVTPFVLPLVLRVFDRINPDRVSP
ncbi:hypothetical protein GCM10027020_17190 [Nocardioides salsibiostraticola]